jgi:putative transposase
MPKGLYGERFGEGFYIKPFAVYRPKAKPENRNFWGSKLLGGLKAKGKRKKSSPGQMRLPWDNWEATNNEEIEEVATKFIFANCYDQKIAGDILQRRSQKTQKTPNSQCQVSETQNP